MARKEERIPTIDECVRARTHMIRCTADGACKVCFDFSDLDEAQLETIYIPKEKK
jgi:hypothetical protein